jgi:ribosome-associated protein
LNPKEIATKIAELALEKKADNVLIMDLKSLTSFADFFVICSADSDTQVRAIADHIHEEMKGHGVSVYNKEGYEASTWIILDFVDVVVHVFHKNTRTIYNLEKMWGDARIKKVEDKIKKVEIKVKKAEVKTKKTAGTVKKPVKKRTVSKKK